MAPRTVGSALGLLAFSTTILVGLWAHNSFASILSRAIGAMFIFFLIGLLMGEAARRVVREHVEHREKELFSNSETDVEPAQSVESVNTSTEAEAKPMGT